MEETQHQNIVVRAHGKPCKYIPEYCQKLIDFFNIEPYTEVYAMSKDGKSVFKERIPNNLPLIGRFATTIGIGKSTIWSWSERYPEFKAALEIAHDMQEYILVTNSLMGLYSPAASIFAMKNLIGWRDKIESEQTVKFSVDSLMQQVRGMNSGKDMLEQKSMRIAGTA
jgi:hypothetical protein